MEKKKGYARRERGREYPFGIRDDTTLFSQRNGATVEMNFCVVVVESQTFVYYVGRYRVSNAHDVAAMLTWPGVVAARKCQASRPIRYTPTRGKVGQSRFIHPLIHKRGR